MENEQEHIESRDDHNSKHQSYRRLDQAGDVELQDINIDDFNELDLTEISIDEKAKDDKIITFKNVFMKYDGKNNFALNNVSFEILKNQKVAICGRTGSGKSSIINSLLKLYDITKGTICYNGINIKNIPTKKLRSQIVKCFILF